MCSFDFVEGVDFLKVFRSFLKYRMCKILVPEDVNWYLAPAGLPICSAGFQPGVMIGWIKRAKGNLNRSVLIFWRVTIQADLGRKKL